MAFNFEGIKSLEYPDGKMKPKPVTIPLWKCLCSEYLGSFLLMFIGIGSQLKVDNGRDHSMVLYAFGWGFTVATLGQALGGVSCDINPAITLAKLLTGKVTILSAVLYIPVQCLGTTSGMALLKLVSPDEMEQDWGVTLLAPGIDPIKGVVIECLSTFCLTLTVFAVSDENRNDIKGSAPLAVGVAVASLVLCSGPLTSASLNPARSLGPSIIAGRFDNHWMYWVGPVSGAALAGFVYENLFKNPAAASSNLDTNSLGQSVVEKI